MQNPEWFESIKYADNGLIPAVAQDAQTGAVLMLAYMNAESVRKTAESGFATFYSRSRQALWLKGETSGNKLEVLEMLLDCDCDTILLKVKPYGPACHTGEATCFFKPLLGNAVAARGAGILHELAGVIRGRKQNPVEGSYTNYLFNKGVDKICKKVGEESAEVIIAAKNADNAELRCEAADLLYHLLVLLEDRGLALDEVFGELEHRR